MKGMERDLITMATAARYLGVTRGAVSNAIRRGRVRKVNRFGRPFVYASEIIEWKAEKKEREDDRLARDADGVVG